ncbi:MAG: hypothetical protein ACO20H_08600 [Bacteriovoracaceae bacterium]
MKTFEKFVTAIVVFFVGLGLYLSITDMPFYEGVYVKEDGPLEWLTFVALVLGSVLCFYRVYILRPFRSGVFRTCLFLLGLVFVFGAGEEISWGQRIFDIKSPEFFVQNNSQQETNLHNLILGDIKVNRLFFGLILGIMVGLYLLVLPLLYKKFEKVRDFVNAVAFPVPRPIHILLFIVVFAMSEMSPSGKKGELIEFGGCWMFLIMTFNPWNRDVFSRISLRR